VSHSARGHHLLKQPELRKLILLVGDGEPAEINERDQLHLRDETRKVVEKPYGTGVLTWCLTLNPNAGPMLGASQVRTTTPVSSIAIVKHYFDMRQIDLRARREEWLIPNLGVLVIDPHRLPIPGLEAVFPLSRLQPGKA
jgi:hypothetical protein